MIDQSAQSNSKRAITNRHGNGDGTSLKLFSRRTNVRGNQHHHCAHAHAGSIPRSRKKDYVTISPTLPSST
ncbi:MAG: hypothetical protein WCG83_04825, partial [Candidatus Peregrinibacteria bacterium]